MSFQYMAERVKCGIHACDKTSQECHFEGQYFLLPNKYYLYISDIKNFQQNNFEQNSNSFFIKAQVKLLKTNFDSGLQFEHC